MPDVFDFSSEEIENGSMSESDWFKRSYCIFTVGPRESDAYKLVKILLRTM
jgi:hypothetical protein